MRDRSIDATLTPRDTRPAHRPFWERRRRNTAAPIGPHRSPVLRAGGEPPGEVKFATKPRRAIATPTSAIDARIGRARRRRLPTRLLQLVALPGRGGSAPQSRCTTCHRRSGARRTSGATRRRQAGQRR
jgi:hypothetical protein